MEQTVFQERLKRAMFLAGIRKTDLAERAGIDRGKVSAYVSGRYKPNAETLAKIAAALGVTPDWLLGREEMPAERERREEDHHIFLEGDPVGMIFVSHSCHIVAHFRSFLLIFRSINLTSRKCQKWRKYAKKGPIPHFLRDGAFSAGGVTRTRRKIAHLRHI